MPRHLVKKWTSLLLLVLIFTATGWGLCRSAGACPEGHRGSVEMDAPESPPAPPCGEHSHDDHDASSCYCSCHLPLTEEPLRVGHVPLVSWLVSCEQFSTLPEVYLPKFIPPQNLA